MFVLIASLFGLRRKKAGWPPERPIGEIADEELMEMYAQGEPKAFEVLLQRHERGVFNFIYRSIPDAAKAEDMTQDVFVRVIKSAASYKRSAKFTTWLYTIARNLCIDQSRRRQVRREVSLQQPLGHDDDGDGATIMDKLGDERAQSGGVSLTRQQFLARLREGLDALPEEQREVFLMREVSGLKFREIADIVNVPENTVKSRMRYALETLQGYMEEFRSYSFDEDEAREVGPA